MLVHVEADEPSCIRIKRNKRAVDVFLQFLVGETPATYADFRPFLILLGLLDFHLLQNGASIHPRISIFVQHCTVFQGPLLGVAGQPVKSLHQVFYLVILRKALRAGVALQDGLELSEDLLILAQYLYLL